MCYCTDVIDCYTIHHSPCVPFVPFVPYISYPLMMLDNSTSKQFYRTSNSRECMESMHGEALQLHAVYKAVFFYHKSRENLYQYYKSITRESISGTTVCASEHAMTSKVRMIKSLSPLYQAIPYHSFVK